jgi:hypothetical protein
MDSYIFIAKVDKKNKSLINNLNALKNSYSKLLEFSSNQEKKFNHLIEEMKSNFVKKTDDLNNENQMKMNELNDHFIKRLEEKELELKEKVSNKEIEEKNQEMERAYDKIKDLEDERMYF